MRLSALLPQIVEEKMAAWWQGGREGMERRNISSSHLSLYMLALIILSFSTLLSGKAAVYFASE